jgi:Protein of unknown function (DUF3822)
VFTIKGPGFEQPDPALSHLLLELGPAYLCYTVFNTATNTFTGLEYYHWDAHEPAETCLKEILALPFLGNHFTKVNIFYHYPEAVLTPGAYYHMDQNRAMLQSVYGDLAEGNIIAEPITGKGMYAIYRIPATIQQLLGDKFPGGNYSHSYSCMVKNTESFARSMTATFYHDFFSLVVMKASRLKLVQQFAYQTPEDVVYHLLNICRQFGIDTAEIELQLGGLIDENSALYKDIYKYFGHIQLRERPAAFGYDAAFDAFPPHFFSPLFNCLSCVS